MRMRSAAYYSTHIWLQACFKPFQSNLLASLSPQQSSGGSSQSMNPTNPPTHTTSRSHPCRAPGAWASRTPLLACTASCSGSSQRRWRKSGCTRYRAHSSSRVCCIFQWSWSETRWEEEQIFPSDRCKRIPGLCSSGQSLPNPVRMNRFFWRRPHERRFSMWKTCPLGQRQSSSCIRKPDTWALCFVWDSTLFLFCSQNITKLKQIKSVQVILYYYKFINQTKSNQNIKNILKSHI